jgi:predicted 3-demethylubiquinone-9 3-methyltransferase (glyoxalase superfamily)
MQKIVPHLWFDKEAKEAAQFYTSVFAKNSKITNTAVITGTPSGDCDIINFELWGYGFQSISAGPYFKMNPSISFMVNFDPSQDVNAKERIDEIWGQLIEGGKILMPIDTYPFSERYGWVEDKYGVSWQLIFTKPEGEERPLIIPSFLFTGDVCGKAEEASDFYLSIFNDSKRGAMARYTAGQEPDKEGTVMFTDFKLSNQWFVAMDSAHKHDFSFNEGVSLIVNCDTQDEIDDYWEKLSAVPEAEQCGWLKDKYGVSWQIVPRQLGKLMNSGDQVKIDRITQAFLKMKKFDIETLEKAARG